MYWQHVKEILYSFNFDRIIFIKIHIHEHMIVSLVFFCVSCFFACNKITQNEMMTMIIMIIIQSLDNGCENVVYIPCVSLHISASQN